MNKSAHKERVRSFGGRRVGVACRMLRVCGRKGEWRNHVNFIAGGDEGSSNCLYINVDLLPAIPLLERDDSRYSFITLSTIQIIDD